MFRPTVNFACERTQHGICDHRRIDERAQKCAAPKDFAIQLNCSGASRIAVSSLNGGMAATGSADGYAAKAPYQVALRVRKAIEPLIA